MLFVMPDLMNLTAEKTVSARERFNRAARCQPVDRPPVWLMRQAGRALPEYRKLKETYTFVQLVQNPELAAEVTLQPIRRFGFDAAILFSDILVIPEAMGQTYSFKETGGVVMDFAVTSQADIEKLSVERVVEKLSYVDRALRILRKELRDQTALLGFAGSPWTLATFMMEGASVPKYSRALQLFREDKKTYFALAEKLTAAITAYLKIQIAAGVDAVQIFDSHGGHLAPTEFQEASGQWIKEIITPRQSLIRRQSQTAATMNSPSSFSPSARTATGPTSSPRAPTSLALTGILRWPTRANSSPRKSPCRAILRQRFWRSPHRKLLRRKPGRFSKPCAGGPGISSTSATV